MRKLICPQCMIPNLYVKNSAGERCNVFVTADYEVVAAHESDSLDGFDVETIYCLGCSWSGSPRRLRKH